MENKPVVDLNWLCNWLEENSSGIYRPAKEAAHVIRSMSSELESIRAQLKAAQDNNRLARWIDRSKKHPNPEQGEKILAWGNGYAFEAEFDDGFWCNIGGDDFTHWLPHPGDPNDAATIPAQQSPAVAVPECFKRLYDHARGMRFGTDWNKGTVASQHRGQLLVAVNDCEKLLESGNCAIQRSSPRITEQDAREIEEFLVNDYCKEYVGQSIENWIRSACRALLNKLNKQ